MNSKLNLYENTHFIGTRVLMLKINLCLNISLINTKTQYILALDAPIFSYLIYRAITDDAFTK